MKTAKYWSDYIWDNEEEKEHDFVEYIKDIQNDALEEALKCCKGVHRSNVADLLIEDKIQKLIKKNNEKEKNL